MANLAVSDFIPAVQFPSVRDRSRVELRESGGKTTLVMTAHSAACAGCRNYVHGLESLALELQVWDARLLVVVPGPVSEASVFKSPLGTVLADERGIVVKPGSASVIVADRYGHIFEATHAGESHDLPSPRELEEWLKYLGTLCPE